MLQQLTGDPTTGRPNKEALVQLVKGRPGLHKILSIRIESRDTRSQTSLRFGRHVSLDSEAGFKRHQDSCRTSLGVGCAA
jgi:hypothetical protein